MTKLEKAYLLEEERPIYQHPDHFRFNTDTKCLARFMKIKKGERVLDIGTNNAALLLEADQSDVKELIGVEILPEAAEIAQLNMRSFAKHPYQIRNQPVQELEIDPVDVILCNPPYFQQQSTNPHIKMDLRQLGRVETNLTLQELAQHAHRLLKSNGRMYLVYRANRLNELIDVLHANCFQIKTLQFIYAKGKSPAKGVLLECIHEGQCDCQVLPALNV